jgi:hypothetical protein
MPLKKFLMWAQAQFVRQVRGPFRRHRGGPLRGAAGGRHGTATRRDWCVVGSKNKWGMIKRTKNAENPWFTILQSWDIFVIFS